MMLRTGQVPSYANKDVQRRHEVSRPLYEIIPKRKFRSGRLAVTTGKMYDLYVERGGTLGKSEWHGFINQVFYEVMEAMIYKQQFFKPPGRRGVFYIRKRRLKSRATDEKIVYSKKNPNLHSDGYYFAFYWLHKPRAYISSTLLTKFRNQSLYEFEVTRDLKNFHIGSEGLHNEIMRRKNDPFVKNYDALKEIPYI